MDDLTLECCLQILLSNCSRVKSFKILASNELRFLADTSVFDAAFIINTSSRNVANKNSLKHWYALYVGRKVGAVVGNVLQGELFCPFGVDPRIKYNIGKLPFKIVAYNKLQIQHELSNKCSLFCLYYIWKKAHGYSLSQIQRHFSHTNLKLNDTLMLRFYKSINTKNLRYIKKIKCCKRLVHSI